MPDTEKTDKPVPEPKTAPASAPSVGAPPPVAPPPAAAVPEPAAPAVSEADAGPDLKRDVKTLEANARQALADAEAEGKALVEEARAELQDVGQRVARVFTREDGTPAIKSFPA